MIQNEAIAGINTDYEVSTILGNFSEELIFNTIQTSLEQRFRPFGLRAPNYPEILYSQFETTKLHSTGHDEVIDNKRDEVMMQIINIICEYYNFQIIDTIPEEQLYSIAYYMYQIFCSEFTQRMVNFFIGYIIQNEESLASSLLSDDASVRTSYAKKIYDNQTQMIILDNMAKVIDMISGLDIDFRTLVMHLSDNNIADLITTYIDQCGDTYKNHYVYFLLNQSTRSEMLVSIRLGYMSQTTQNETLQDPMLNPYFINPLLEEDD